MIMGFFKTVSYNTLKYEDFKSLNISKNDFNYIIITSPKALKFLKNNFKYKVISQKI